ncbi:uncharacterized protein SETTUDRAFT_86794 [Exserohilum turcica Et28A]|uniref:Uncharacterized protein n=1 Tax=Exserohilum turcicum (strain 28A) TaxID=671987 RepID=R0J6H9_EXST2|nr:uncharacterized protein SETTUDRAFT_86794 [Exserohilum turcica Et28A]EOA92306.1 hypothetical protein SETTUDRAFT_86794 [Exserohilum turcica Et28A]
MKGFAFMCLIAAALAAPAAVCQKAAAVTGAACTKAQTELEAGIQANLDIQAQELKGYNMSMCDTVMKGFVAQQKAVLDIQSKGIAIRAKNQELAKQLNSPAIDGLATVAKAQVQEKDQVSGLKGTAADMKTLATLVQEVEDGTKQNEKNLAAAKSQKCAA